MEPGVRERRRRVSLRFRINLASPPGEAGVTPISWKPRRLLWGYFVRLRDHWSQVQFPASQSSPAIKSSCIGGLVIGMLAALLLFTDANHPLLDPDEGRQAEIPREMLAHHDLLVPRMIGVPYYDKPPLQYWLTAASYRAFGLRVWAARLVPGCAALITILLAYVWGLKMVGLRAAFLGGLGLCATTGFIILGRTITLDSLLTACVIAGWFTGHAAVAQKELRWQWWLASAAACGLGILAKGPVALVLIAPPLFVYQLLVAVASRPRFLPWFAYGCLTLVVAAPWYVAMALHEPEFVQHFLWKSNVIRFMNPYDHEQPWWFYLPVLFGFTFPWSLLWPALAYYLFSRSPRMAVLRSQGMGFCALAFGWCMLFYSCSGCKSPPYIAPALVALSFLVGGCLNAVLYHRVDCTAAIWQAARVTLPRGAAMAVLLLSAGCCLTTAILRWQSWNTAIAQTVPMLAVAGLWARYSHRASPTLAWATCAAATLACNLLAVQSVLSGYAARHSPMGAAHLVRHVDGSAQAVIVSYGRQYPSASFYLRRDLVPFWGLGRQQNLLECLRFAPQVLVLVEGGRPLNDLLQGLPATLEARALEPEREGRVTLLVVRPRSSS